MNRPLFFLKTIVLAATLLFLLLPQSFSDETSAELSKLDTRLRSVERQLEDLKKSQEAEMAAQEGIIQEIKRLKIWVNKNRHGKA